MCKFSKKTRLLRIIRALLEQSLRLKTSIFAGPTGQDFEPHQIHNSINPHLIMLLFKKVADLQLYLQQIQSRGSSVAFVPTMGALHQGHLALIQQAQASYDLVVCSIFVNPTQFNDEQDLEKYPRTVENDIELLEGIATDILFYPSVDEVYPKHMDTSLKLDLGLLDQVMEGFFRPGHFEGMAQVVKRLLDIVRPQALFMGQKDFQQFTIVQHMLEQLELPVKLVMSPIIREEDQLAMSSRNRRLTSDIRKRATILYKALEQAKKDIKQYKPDEVKRRALEQMTIPDFRPEYFEIVDGNTLQPIESWDEHNYVVACTAVWAGEVRLIDNMIFYQKE